MAKMDHYEDGKWIGSTDIPVSTEKTGWVYTYGADGKCRATWVDNCDAGNASTEEKSVVHHDGYYTDRRIAEEKALGCVDRIVMFVVGGTIIIFIILFIIYFFIALFTQNLSSFFQSIKEFFNTGIPKR